jgi:L-fuconolactonase
MRTFARRADFNVQLSGLPFLYGDAWQQDHARALLDDALAIFGPDRLMFASDWPMMLRFATYEAWVHAVEAFMAKRGLSSRQQEAILAENVRRANPRMQIPVPHVH